MIGAGQQLVLVQDPGPNERNIIWNGSAIETNRRSLSTRGCVEFAASELAKVSLQIHVPIKDRSSTSSGNTDDNTKRRAESMTQRLHSSSYGKKHSGHVSAPLAGAAVFALGSYVYTSVDSRGVAVEQ